MGHTHGRLGLYRLSVLAIGSEVGDFLSDITGQTGRVRKNICFTVCT